MYRCVTLVFFLITLCLASLRAQDSTPAGFPFAPGEKLYYSLKWGPFMVGEAILEVVDIVDEFGEPAYHITFDVRTNDFADNFYRVRILIESYPNLDMTRSTHYRSDQKEGDEDKSFDVTFDWENQTIIRDEGDKTRDPLHPEHPLHDPLSILFYFRTLDLGTHTSIPLPATDGKRMIDVDAAVIGSEQIKVHAGTFDTIRIQPNLKDLGGVFKKSKDAAMDIWFSDDEFRYPVRLKSKVRVGSFRAALRRIARDGEIIEISDDPDHSDTSKSSRRSRARR